MNKISALQAMLSRNRYAGSILVILFAGVGPLACKKDDARATPSTRSADQERPKIEGWGGLRWGDSVTVVKSHYPDYEESIQNTAAWEHTLTIRKAQVPGVAVSYVMFDFRSEKLSAVFISGSLVGDLVNPLVRKYGYAQRSENHTQPFVGEEMINIWRDDLGNAFRVRAFPGSGSVYLDYYSAAGEARRAREEAAAHAQENRGI